MNYAFRIIPALAVFLTACQHTPPVPPTVLVDARPAEADARAVDTAERVCAVDSLRAERDARVETARDLVYGQLGAPDMQQTTDDRVTVNQPPAGPQSELTERLRVFELDLDAAYRFAATACQAYAMCMHSRDYDDRVCAGVRGSWDAAQERFVAASAELGQLRAHIANEETALHPERTSPRDRHERCDPPLTAVFTTQGC